MVSNSRIDAQEIVLRQLEAREDGARAKGGARLSTARGAVADVEGQRLGEGRLEDDAAALTPGFHGGRAVCSVGGRYVRVG